MSIIFLKQDRCHVLYHFTVVQDGAYPLIHVDYSVPRGGNKLWLPLSIIFHFPLLGEAVSKMIMFAMALRAYNSIYESSGMSPIVHAVTNYKPNKIGKARQAYEKTKDNWKIHDSI